MTATVPTATTPTSGSTPAWLEKAETYAPTVLGAVVAWVDPTGKINTGALQAAVFLAGLAISGVILLVRTVAANGLSKAGLARDVTDEEAWIKANYSDIKATFEAAKPALDALPGFPAALAKVETDVAAVKARDAAVPATDVAAVESIVRRVVIPNVLAAPSPAAANTVAVSAPPDVAPGAVSPTDETAAAAAPTA